MQVGCRGGGGGCSNGGVSAAWLRIPCRSIGPISEAPLEPVRARYRPGGKAVVVAVMLPGDRVPELLLVSELSPLLICCEGLERLEGSRASVQGLPVASALAVTLGARPKRRRGTRVGQHYCL